MTGRGGRAVRALFIGALVVLAAWPPSAYATFPGQNGKIAFSNFSLATDTWLVKTVNPDGTGQTTVRTGYQPDWSPDGGDLLFVREDDIRRMPASGNSETALLNAEGLIPPGGGSWQTPAWSSDGSQIVASFINGDESDNPYTVLYTASAADGSGAQRIAYGQSPTWRPDGSEIAFNAHYQQGEIHVVHPDGTGEGSIIEPLAFDPDYSPDGTKIVYSAYPEGGSTQEIYVHSGFGTPEVRLTNNTDHDGDPVWSPDGTKIAFRSDRHGDSAIYTMNADGTNPTRITNDPDYQAQPSWQPLPYPGYARPKSAQSVRVPLVPASLPCTAPNREHGPPLTFGSCNPPAPVSQAVTVGSAMTGSMRYRALVGDIGLRLHISDVRERGSTDDYTGGVEAQATAQLTDRSAGVPATASDVRIALPTQCSPTAATDVGSTCSLKTTLDTLIPGAISAGRRTVLQLAQVEVIALGPEAGPAADPVTANKVFLRQGVFVP